MPTATGWPMGEWMPILSRGRWLPRVGTRPRKPHHSRPEVMVWILKPALDRKRWYIKCSLKGGKLVLISVHPSGR